MQHIIAAELRDASGKTIPALQGWPRAALSLRQCWRVTGLFAGYGFICGQTDPANQFWQMVSSPSQYTSQHVILRTLALH